MTERALRWKVRVVVTLAALSCALGGAFVFEHLRAERESDRRTIAETRLDRVGDRLDDLEAHVGELTFTLALANDEIATRGGTPVVIPAPPVAPSPDPGSTTATPTSGSTPPSVPSAPPTTGRSPPTTRPCLLGIVCL